MNIYVGNISREVTDTELQDLFTGYGEVGSAKIIRDHFTGESKGFGFVEMPESSSAIKALNELNNQDLKGRKIVVNEARPREDKPRNDRKENNRW
jgi:RNA recognition motif-containing protein